MKRNTIRRGFVHELLNAQDTVLCSYFAQRMVVVVRRAMGKKSFKDWKDLNDNWGKAVERNMDRKGK